MSYFSQEKTKQNKKKTDYDTKIWDIEIKYIITTGYNEFTTGSVANQIKNKNLINKSDISRFINKAR